VRATLHYERATFRRYLPQAAFRRFCAAYPELNGEVDVTLVNAGILRKLKAEYFGEDKTTDVLSFPLEAVPGDPNPNLGSIVISPLTTLGWGETVLEVLHHGLLHIRGFDHDADQHAWDTAEHETLDALEKAGFTRIRSRSELVNTLPE
jgi:probable rRNA maturation factor